MMSLIRLALRADTAALEAVETALDDSPLAPLSIARFEDAGGWTLEALFTDAPDRGAVADLLGAALGRVPPFDLAPLPDRDWIALSLAGLAPVRAGRFVVHGAHDRQAAPPGGRGIEIEAGAAFGTGHHATTLGCLVALEGLYRTLRRPRILDIGTGTGVLAIAAAKLWKLPVVAGEIDPAAVAVAAGNARLNAVGQLVRPLRAAGTADRRIAAGGPYKLVVANILAQPLIAMAGPVAAITLQSSKIVLSGLLDSQQRGVLAAWRARGFAPVRKISIDGWTTLVLARPGPPGRVLQAYQRRP